MTTENPEELTPHVDEESLAEPGAAGDHGPLDGRDGQAGAGSDNPELLNAEDEATAATRLADQEDLTVDQAPLPEEL
ncbi:MAG: hypothetical protein Q4G34_04890 [Micrococcus sp.]|nr:hypothetical protein [Micrococcus sp.]